jgi:MYXO-CTERM domain-containing protein
VCTPEEVCGVEAQSDDPAGCGCRSLGASGRVESHWLLVLLALSLAGRRRQRSVSFAQKT